MNRSIWIASWGLVAACISSLAYAQSSGVAKGSLALVGGTIYVDSQAAPIRNGVVLIRDGVITGVGSKGAVKIPKDIETIDCSGKTVTAGFWNSHVHFLERKWMDVEKLPADELSKQLEVMLTQYGFTSVFDTWSNFVNTRRLRDRVESGAVTGPRIRTTGEAIQPKRGVAPSFATNLLGFGPVEPYGIEDAAGAQAAAIKLLDAGVDGIKVYAMTFAPRVAMPEDAIAAAATEAHKRGKLLFAHPTSDEALLAAVRAGADVIVHTTARPGPWDASVTGPMKERGVALIPTLTLWHSELKHDRHSIEQERIKTSVAQLKSWMDVGGAVLFGTDVGYIPEYDTTEEFQLMAKAGMDYRQILASLTSAPAEKFGEGQRLGKLAVGFLGDVVVMEGDPAKDVTAFAAIRYSIRDGKAIYRWNGQR